MTEEDAEALKEQIDKLRFAPTENERSQLLIARAERIIEETLSFERQAVAEALMNYKACLLSGNDRDIRITAHRLTGLLDNTEGRSTGIEDDLK